ncbi:hypothetical protein KJ840_01185 [Patescibacteria group bacterium]|nr:hypothetical protein [Patescibacteria group bacterium]
MRDVLTLSIPSKTKELIKRKAKKSGFPTVSGYIQFLIRQDENLISEETLLQSIKEAQKEYDSGQAIKAKSIKDFL